MPGALVPIFVGEKTAALLFDMKTAQFRSLVDGGQLPRPKWIGEFERWDTRDLRRIASGEAIEGLGEVQW